MPAECPEVPNRRKSVRKYASELFKDSSVSAVALIVSAGNNRRKVFRILIFLLFTAGFLYHCIKFLVYMLQYPTVVNIEMSRPKEYMAPAYTFCNYNMLKRSKFCSSYPDQCSDSVSELCKKYPRYCKGNSTTKVPIDDVWSHLDNFDVALKFGHGVKDFLKDGAWETPSGPFLRLNEEENTAAACYSLGERIDSKLPARYKTKQSDGKFVNDELVFDPEEHETLFPKSNPGMLFSIHNPFEAVNPFEQGTFMKPGCLYRITIQKTIEELLPYPYKTDCVNYTDVWFKANKTGPRSQEMCREMCMRDVSEVCFNCTIPGILYPPKSKYCTLTDLAVKWNISNDCAIDQLDDRTDPCVSNCKNDCVRSKFSYKVQETYLTHNMVEDDEDESRKIKVKIYFDDSETLKIQYKPQYQEVEMFSYIGGFIGIWLGVSLVQVADVFESLFLVVRYFCRKQNKGFSRKSEIPSESISLQP